MMLAGLQGMAQTKNLLNNDRITITGIVPDSMINPINKAPYITFYDNYNSEDPSSREIIPLKITNGKFEVTITPHNQFGYFDVGGGMFRSITNDEFLIERGDSILITISNLNTVAFSGKGSQMLNYQNWAGKYIWSDKKVWGPKDKMEDIMNYDKQRAVRFMAVTMNVLNKDTTLGSQVKNVLRLNTASSISKQYLNGILSPSNFSDSTYYRKVKEEVNFLITQQNGFLVSDPTLLQNFFMYIQYLFELNKAIAMIKARSDKSSAQVVYNNIKLEYDGLLRDKVLPYCFLTMLKRNPDIISNLPEALSLVKDSIGQRILKQVALAKSSGARAYNFLLETLDKRQIKLSDFKGKLIVLETYYNGCLPCRELAAHMEPIAEHYKNEKNLVFISMDAIARDYTNFEKGAKSGKYGSKQAIYTWTSGMGQIHPLLLYYQYNSFPNLLVIDKNGNIISSNPEKPLDDESTKKFISMINQNL
ncbi:AhpC/TSA family protein [Mucilaginibacter lappiensis]|nr:AhpC/TSA family protein [Mucilaginibacter lappiensis]